MDNQQYYDLFKIESPSDFFKRIEIEEAEETVVDEGKVIVAINKEYFLFKEEEKYYSPKGESTLDMVNMTKTIDSNSTLTVCEIESMDLALEHFLLWKKNPENYIALHLD